LVRLMRDRAMYVILQLFPWLIFFSETQCRG